MEKIVTHLSNLEHVSDIQDKILEWLALASPALGEILTLKK
jgi:hypothetical protein